MALQPVVGLWPLLQFRNHFYTDDRTPWTSGNKEINIEVERTVNS
jgi:hypothetical protein